MGKRWVFGFLLTIAFVCGSAAVLADDDAEREVLARIIHELDALDPLIREGEAKGNPSARVRFHYGWLRQDLFRVKSGIREHIEAPRTEPREVQPLQGDYRR